jgi:putative Ca2+/H+ antiporter (TMEM165/GDT1 family)
MDALLTALLACLIVEMGDRCQLLTLALSVRYKQHGAVISGLFLAAFANAALSAAAGGLIAPLLGPDARSLFLALALVSAGIGMLMPVKRPDLLTGWRLGAFATTALGLFILAFGNGAQFVAMAIAVHTADPILTALGAGLGVGAACLPVILLQQRFFTMLPIRWIRRAGGILLLLIGTILGLGAAHLM